MRKEESREQIKSIFPLRSRFPITCFFVLDCTPLSVEWRTFYGRRDPTICVRSYSGKVIEFLIIRKLISAFLATGGNTLPAVERVDTIKILKNNRLSPRSGCVLEMENENIPRRFSTRWPTDTTGRAGSSVKNLIGNKMVVSTDR